MVVVIGDNSPLTRVKSMEKKKKYTIAIFLDQLCMSMQHEYMKKNTCG
jgi:hypothetical protein